MKTPSDIQTIVITGSTRGIGLGLAHAFADAGQQVVISGRSQETVDAVVADLQSLFPEHAAGFACDVTRREDVDALWDFAAARFGRVDIWINNAGISHEQAPVYALPSDQMRAVNETNIIGTLYGVHTAVRGMLNQGGGTVYNLEGLGSDGRKVEGLGVYGSTKCCIKYLNDSLIDELKGSTVRIGAIQPGMVLTDMLIGENRRAHPNWESSRRIFNILADRVDVVAPWIVRQVLCNTKHGKRIRRMSAWTAAWRFFSYPFTKRDVISSLLDTDAEGESI
ncbi:MAG: SDR family NAD(P)-dependent oxidoreductase [Anaerolineales bacterium]|nr:SDR family NAD(P)-dependent oxidoreductase [Anaerolineales bacterium]